MGIQCTNVAFSRGENTLSLDSSNQAAGVWFCVQFCRERTTYRRIAQIHWKRPCYANHKISEIRRAGCERRQVLVNGWWQVSMVSIYGKRDEEGLRPTGDRPFSTVRTCKNLGRGGNELPRRSAEGASAGDHYPTERWFLKPTATRLAGLLSVYRERHLRSKPSDDHHHGHEPQNHQQINITGRSNAFQDIRDRKAPTESRKDQEPQQR
jgi:hypothetical protein